MKVVAWQNLLSILDMIFLSFDQIPLLEYLSFSPGNWSDAGICIFLLLFNFVPDSIYLLFSSQVDRKDIFLF
jgi:hypothetical protein